MADAGRQPTMNRGARSTPARSRASGKSAAGVELGGRLLDGPVTFRAGSNEGLTWQQLIAGSYRRRAGGLAVAEVGQRLADAGAERAEISNLAARHVHALRARLSNAGAIVTANRAYRPSMPSCVGQVRRRP